MQKRPAKVYVKLVGVVGRLGFEPGMTEPKPVVLPLHHRPIRYAGAKVVKIWQSAKFSHTFLILRSANSSSSYPFGRGDTYRR